MATNVTQPPEHGSGWGEPDVVTAGLNTERGQAIYTLAYLLAPANTRRHRVQVLLPVLRAALDDPDERVRVLLPPAIVRVWLSDRNAGVGLAEQWLARMTDACLNAPELDRLVWQLLLSSPQAGTTLLQQMIHSPVADVRIKSGSLAALVSLRRDALPDGDGPLGVFLRDALRDPAARRGVAVFLAQLVDDLPDPPDSGSDVVADRRLLIALLNDDDGAVREAAARLTFSNARPLSRQATLLAATAKSRAFAEHPGSVLHALPQVLGRVSGCDLSAGFVLVAGAGPVDRHV